MAKPADQAMNQPSTLNQVAAATITAPAISPRPSPSRRCSGSRSRAPLPMPRAIVPISKASEVQTAAIPGLWPRRTRPMSPRRAAGRRAGAFRELVFAGASS